jgi:hypothetical protein
MLGMGPEQQGAWTCLRFCPNHPGPFCSTRHAHAVAGGAQEQTAIRAFLLQLGCGWGTLGAQMAKQKQRTCLLDCIVLRRRREETHLEGAAKL